MKKTVTYSFVYHRILIEHILLKHNDNELGKFLTCLARNCSRTIIHGVNEKNGENADKKKKFKKINNEIAEKKPHL